MSYEVLIRNSFLKFVNTILINSLFCDALILDIWFVCLFQDFRISIFNPKIQEYKSVKEAYTHLPQSVDWILFNIPVKKSPVRVHVDFPLGSSLTHKINQVTSW